MCIYIYLYKYINMGNCDQKKHKQLRQLITLDIVMINTSYKE